MRSGAPGGGQTRTCAATAARDCLPEIPLVVRDSAFPQKLQGTPPENSSRDDVLPDSEYRRPQHYSPRPFRARFILALYPGVPGRPDGPFRFLATRLAALHPRLGIYYRLRYKRKAGGPLKPSFGACGMGDFDGRIQPPCRSRFPAVHSDSISTRPSAPVA